jgi:hypothetical protein
MIGVIVVDQNIDSFLESNSWVYETGNYRSLKGGFHKTFFYEKKGSKLRFGYRNSKNEVKLKVSVFKEHPSLRNSYKFLEYGTKFIIYFLSF